MVSSQSSAPSSEDGIDPTALRSPSDGGSEGNSPESAPRPGATSLVAGVVSSSRLHPSNLPASGSSGRSAAYGASSINHRAHIGENDIVIAVMGATGTGKSSFVNQVAGRDEVMIGYDLKSQTRNVQPVRCTHPDGCRNIVLVDTPGFDDTRLSDFQVLTIIATWLKDTYQNNIRLAGILYLHRISDVRFSGTPLKNMSVFRDLCGDGNLKNVVLVTTMWDEVEESIGSRREKELLSDFWEDMIQHGSHTCRFRGTPTSAWEIIGRLDLDVSSQGRTQLKIQQEMVDRRLPLAKTTAAKTLLRFLMGEMKRAWSWLRVGTRRIFGAKRPESLRRHTLSKSFTRKSSLSETTQSANSSTDTLNNRSQTVSASTGCNVSGRRDTLSSMIAALGLGYQAAGIVASPALRGAIEAVLHIAQPIEGMGGVHHAIVQVIEYAGWLLKETIQFAATSKLSKHLQRALNSFTKELSNLQDVVTSISKRDHAARFFLYDTDIPTIGACTSSIRAIHDTVEVRLAADDREVMAGLEAQLRELRCNPALRQCQCGTSVLYEESREPEDRQLAATTG